MDMKLGTSPRSKRVQEKQSETRLAEPRQCPRSGFGGVVLTGLAFSKNVANARSQSSPVFILQD
ncbi:hypothetical protein BM221_008796 [Beauveria bassiana]|uniref:Uncharacterized protein n=1 Tax=Beauveria bassiana TaxID=176275 RepID=A0A2N6NDT1_BEABA|nr:hypothetical protein BM221_008796 [Beauveria bassiana]